ncbi:hypothetical protein E2C01_057597 [Portunus trituberculatus]|uniref:Uncharacterized protein n=1 Tax=Portunus trituberculatus TaxID=210409 RepID=A0A5B7H0S3_PORTR|nr:hypothetical protein [Portunus trituberculatus]
MAIPNPVSDSPSGEDTRNVPRSDYSLSGDPNCRDTSPDFFYINFCNICGSLKAEVPLESCLCQLENLRRYYADFSWE